MTRQEEADDAIESVEGAMPGSKIHAYQKQYLKPLSPAEECLEELFKHLQVNGYNRHDLWIILEKHWPKGTAGLPDIDGQVFHKLLMSYRSSPIDTAQGFYKQIMKYLKGK